MNNIKGGRNP